MDDVLNSKTSGTGQLLAGVADVNITPAVGAWLSGYDARKQPSQGVHDELHGKALVLTDGRTRVAIVTVDLIALGQDLVDQVRQRILEASHIPSSNVLLAASHTHGGPITQRLEMFEEPDPSYMAELARKLAGAVYVANNRLQAATLGVGLGRVEFNINRRLPTAEGVVMRPNPQGPTDQTVGVIRIDSPEEAPIAVLMQYACHATGFGSDNLLISADYPGAAQHLVEQVYGPRCTAMFLQGCSGDLRPNLVNADGRFRGGSSKEVRSLGRILGAEVVKVCENIQTREALLAAGSTQVRLPFGTPPTRTRLTSLVEDLEGRSTLSDDDKLDLVWARSMLAQAEQGPLPTGLEVEIQAMRLGPLCLVALPGEVFIQIGQRIQSRVEGTTFVVGCANNVVGYIPTAETHRAGGRNYEANVAYKAGPYPAPFAPESEDLLVDTACSLVENLGKEFPCPAGRRDR